MSSCGKLMNRFLPQFLVASDRELMKAHKPPQSCVSKGTKQELTLQGLKFPNDVHLSVDGGYMFVRVTASVKLSQ